MIIKPIVILGAPRSGTTILQRCLSIHPDIWHLPTESHQILEGPFHPRKKGYDSNRELAEGLDKTQIARLQVAFYREAINLNRVLLRPDRLFMSYEAFHGRVVQRLVTLALGKLSCLGKPSQIRMVEKTPKNTLRIPLLERIFPDAYYVWVKRDAAATIDSLISGWYAFDHFGPFKRKHFATYPIAHSLDLQDYDYRWWNFALVPGWQDLKGTTVADVASWQYFQCTSYIVQDLQAINAKKIFEIKYERFTETPVETLHKILEWADLASVPVMDGFAKHYVRSARKKMRHPDRVLAAMERLPALRGLEKSIGYVNA